MWNANQQITYRLEAERPMDENSTIAVESLSIAYGKQLVLRDVNLTARKGKITALVGPSGCGKSSFLMSLNRLHELVQGCRIEGDIKLGKQSIFGQNINVIDLRRRIGMIFQRPTPFPLSVHRNIAIGLQEHGSLKRTEIENRVQAVLKQVGLWNEVKDRLNQPAASLSGGQQQRLCLARALALNPVVLLLDEPCSALDPLSTSVIEEQLSEIKDRHTILLVTHNLAQARRLADDLALFWVRDGVGYLVEAGPAGKLFEAPDTPIARAYFSGLAG